MHHAESGLSLLEQPDWRALLTYAVANAQVGKWKDAQNLVCSARELAPPGLEEHLLSRLNLFKRKKRLRLSGRQLIDNQLLAEKHDPTWTQTWFE